MWGLHNPKCIRRVHALQASASDCMFKPITSVVKDFSLHYCGHDFHWPTVLGVFPQNPQIRGKLALAPVYDVWKRHRHLRKVSSQL